MRHIPIALLEAYLLLETLNRLRQAGWSWIDPALILAVILPLHLLAVITLRRRSATTHSPRVTSRPSQQIPSRAPQQRPIPQPAHQPPKATLVATRRLTHKARPDRECHRRNNARIHNS